MASAVLEARFKFNTRFQKVDESLDQFAKAIAQLVSGCAYPLPIEEQLVRDRFLAGLSDAQTQKLLLKSCHDEEVTSAQGFLDYLKREKTSREEPLQCDHCPSRFKHKGDLTHHVRQRHLDQVDHQSCDECGNGFLTHLALRIHRRKVHKVDGLTCPHCPQVFSHKKSLDRHCKSKHSQLASTYTCPKCEKPHLSAHALNLHLKIGHKVHNSDVQALMPATVAVTVDSQPLGSTAGDQLLTTSDQVLPESHKLLSDNHVLSLQPDIPISDIQVLAADSLTLSGGPQLEAGVEEQPSSHPSKLCSLCGVMVKNPRDHALNVHSGDGDSEVFKCDSCDFSHANKKAVSAHKRTKHGARAKRECPECDYKTHSKVDLFQQSSDVFTHPCTCSASQLW